VKDFNEIIINADSSYFTQVTSFDNQAYILDFCWNTRDERWRLTIKNMRNENILLNIKILPFIPLVKRFKIELLPTLDSFGKDFKLFYLTEKEIQEIKENKYD
jgi:hypothetical protein